MDKSELIDRYAEIAIKVGVNLQPGQLLQIGGAVEHSEFVRALTWKAYEAGARYVDVQYADAHVRKAMLTHADDDTLTWTPPWVMRQGEDLAEEQGAYIGVVGDPEPNLFADLDPVRVGGARMLQLAELVNHQINDRLISWALVACPTDGWAESVFGEPDTDRLWDAVARATRLYDEDPVASWWAHVEELGRRSDALNKHKFDAIRYTGPGTDLTIGLSERSSMGERALRDRLGNAPRSQPSNRGGFHLAGLPAHRGGRYLIASATDRQYRCNGQGPEDHVRGGQGDRGRCERRCRRRQGADGDRRAGRVPRGAGVGR